MTFLPNFYVIQAAIFDIDLPPSQFTAFFER